MAIPYFPISRNGTLLRHYSDSPGLGGKEECLFELTELLPGQEILLLYRYSLYGDFIVIQKYVGDTYFFSCSDLFSISKTTYVQTLQTMEAILFCCEIRALF